MQQHVAARLLVERREGRGDRLAQRVRRAHARRDAAPDLRGALANVTTRITAGSSPPARTCVPRMTLMCSPTFSGGAKVDSASATATSPAAMQRLTRSAGATAAESLSLAVATDSRTPPPPPSPSAAPRLVPLPPPCAAPTTCRRMCMSTAWGWGAERSARHADTGRTHSGRTCTNTSASVLKAKAGWAARRRWATSTSVSASVFRRDHCCFTASRLVVDASSPSAPSASAAAAAAVGASMWRRLAVLESRNASTRPRRPGQDAVSSCKSSRSARCTSASDRRSSRAVFGCSASSSRNRAWCDDTMCCTTSRPITSSEALTHARAETFVPGWTRGLSAAGEKRRAEAMEGWFPGVC